MNFSGLWVCLRGLKHHSRVEMDCYLASLDVAVFLQSLQRILLESSISIDQPIEAIILSLLVCIDISPKSFAGP